ncbi:hypothetical protein LWI29_018014 [Acer saccharum]|uniref:Serine aminopeptidase S33 domain-containing protein n=1 Tax=Acer saccharum TaxID=4024 RepID=A0AA39VXF8_ACESA|nr:hypothetical protein LWI29_018014 [Acer saccharum]
MDLTSTLRFRSPELRLFTGKSNSPFNNPLKHQAPILIRPNKKTVSVPTARTATHLTVKAESEEDMSEKFKWVKLQNLDFAPARRLVRTAFTEEQSKLDHCLFKVHCCIRIWCLRLDHPGFGLSDGLHGYISDFDELVDNVIETYTKIKGSPELRSVPRFILGQSMGGAVTLKVHLKEPQAWDGVILVAPMCKIAEEMKPPPVVLKALTCLAKVMPKAKLFPQKDLAPLAFRDLRKGKWFAVYNVICYDDLTRLKTGVELLKATDDIEKNVDKVSAPLLILHGAADKVTDPKVSQFLHERASSTDKTLKLYEEGFHCILEGEPDDRIFTVLNDIISWLDERCLSK